MVEKNEEVFAVYAVRKNDPTPLIQTHVEFKRLMDDIIVPYESEDLFFIDGASVKATDLDRIKIIRQKVSFNRTLNHLHYGMRSSGDLKKQDLYAKQYHIRLEALLRESGEDVTAQVIKAFRTAIKPKIKDYLPKKEVLLDAAVKVFTESIRVLSST
ncbi:hypothetical protein [Prosthecochloris sp.]|uniref:hypothetical protein n=1 Tax=Prosthecochloris sp. TaxID=290513 RepID=UPI0025806B4C|nr:hypothetical protein [Prosthecochloris sp.]